MRKRVFGKRFKKDTNQRKALFRSLINGLIINGRISTTEAKAKAIKGKVEKLITEAKNKGEQARDNLLRNLNPDIADKIIKQIAPRFKERPGGYTRILRLGTRLKDNARMVLLEFVESSELQNENVLEKAAVKKGSDNTDKKKEVKKTKKEITALKKVGDKKNEKSNTSDKKK